MRRRWVCLMMVCVCLPVQMGTGAETLVGENLILEETVGDQTRSRLNYATYFAEAKQWDPSTVNALDYGIDAEMEARVTSYGDHTYMWSDGQSELFVTDYGFAGFYTPRGRTWYQILIWYGGCEALSLGSDAFEFATASEAIQTADGFLTALGISGAVCQTVHAFSREAAEERLAEMRAEGYDENPQPVNDVYVLSYAVEIDGLLCDTEYFDMANERIIEGIAIQVVVDAEGVILMDPSGNYYETTGIYPDAPSTVLSFEEIKQVVAAQFDELILSDPVRISMIKLQYVLQPIDTQRMVYIPCWCFAMPIGSSGQCYWYRFNAYTGAEII